MDIKKIESIQYAQGWLGTQIDSMLSDANEKEREIANQVKKMWDLVDQGVDALIRENNELSLKLSAARIALN